jgi:hypothetical protein
MCTNVVSDGQGHAAAVVPIRQVHTRVSSDPHSMDESATWGLLGVLLAVVGAVVIAPEVLHVVGGGGEDPTGTLMLTVYGAGVAVAVVVTAVVILPDVLSRASR